MDDFFEIGVIAGTHGIKGVLKVFPTTDEPSRFELLKKVYVELGSEKQVFNISSVAYHKKFVLLKLKGIDDINEAEGYKGVRILIDEKDGLKLEDDEYFMRDLYDIDVYTVDNEYLGKINEIYKTGANDVYSVINPNAENKNALLIPAIKNCIIDVNIKDRKMIVKLLEGLRD